MPKKRTQSKDIAPIPDDAVIEAGYKLDLDLKRIEELYAKGADHQHVAEALGISVTHWKSLRNTPEKTCIGEEVNAAILAAIKRGRHRCREKVLDLLMTHAEKNDKAAAATTMFLAKQDHILGFRDQWAVEHSGTVEHVLSPARQAYEEHVKQLPKQQEAIDAEYVEVE